MKTVSAFGCFSFGQEIFLQKNNIMTMQQCVGSTGYFCLFIFLARAFVEGHEATILLANPTTPEDYINRTCERCSELSLAFSDAFCVASLSQVPVAHVTNIQGLAIISMELALQNATASVSSIKVLLEGKSLSPFTKLCLEDCLELYTGAISTLADSIKAFMLGQYEPAGVWMSVVMDAAGTCEDGFRKKEGAANPLTIENWSMFQLAEIALCIIYSLSRAPQLILY